MTNSTVVSANSDRLFQSALNPDFPNFDNLDRSCVIYHDSYFDKFYV